ncbi:PEPxxWA-CTERM sorting domain-containing protein [Sandaracinobacteroides hominis]|uniref:PEPxxWA-CTERM sorting domain-containing protein n=1 Tax=Sandaracinobacteroides hominis TaxID=2780086 RepID=UPI0018F5495A|nr:PEPxxWA-CTERM sorting domain-containing protein [Sandaracinobacteroides hominis]
MLTSGLKLSAALLLAAPAIAAPVDLSGWTAEGTSKNWVVQPGNNSVLQTVNGNPTVFYGTSNAIGNKLSGTIRVGADGDDDYIGFVLGFDPGELSAATPDYMLIDWKQNNQDVAKRGLSISRVTGAIQNGQNNAPWAHTGVVQELQRGATLGDTGWVDNVTYSFDLYFYASNIQVWVDGVKQIDLDGSFSDGRFGFYNYSQSSALYAGIMEDVLPPIDPPVGGIPEPTTWAMLIAGFGLVGGAARRRRGNLVAA